MNTLAAINIGEKFLGNDSQLTTLTGVGKVASLFINIAFVVAGMILLFLFILGGIGLVGSAGQSDPQKAEQAKKTLTSALIGFVIVFASYWIVKLVGELLGIEII